MTSPISGFITWPALALVIAVVFGRWRLVNDTAIDRIANRSLVFGILTNVLRDAGVEKLIARPVWFAAEDSVINIVRQLSFATLLVAIAGIYGIAKIWSGAAPETARTRQRRYDSVAIAASVVILIAGTPARQHNLLIDEYLGWEAVIAWIAFYMPLAAVAYLVASVAVQEIRASDATFRERTMYGLVVLSAAALALDAVYTPLATTMEVMSGAVSKDPKMGAKASVAFVSMIVAAALAAVPLISALLIRGEWDRTSRYCRRLRPLWADLTSAVPAVVLSRPEAHRIEPATRLRRMIVEIRDALLHLKNYAPGGNDFNDVPSVSGAAQTSADFELFDYAVQMVLATEVKRAGASPIKGKSAVPGVVRPGARDLAAELDQLLELARIWPKARRTPSNDFSGADRAR